MECKTDKIHPWDVKETLDELHCWGYYPQSSRMKKGGDSLVSRWPKVLPAVVEGEADLALSIFGAALFYLQRNLIDKEILTMGVIKAYVPPCSLAVTTTVSKMESSVVAKTSTPSTEFTCTRK